MSKLGHVSSKLSESFAVPWDCSQTVGSDIVAANQGLMLGSSPDIERRKAAGVLFQQLVNEAQRIFGQSGCPLGSISFGIESKVEVTQWSLVNFLPPEKKAMQDLRTFYSYIDEKFVGKWSRIV